MSSGSSSRIGIHFLVPRVLLLLALTNGKLMPTKRLCANPLPWMPPQSSCCLLVLVCVLVTVIQSTPVATVSSLTVDPKEYAAVEKAFAAVMKKNANYGGVVARVESSSLGKIFEGSWGKVS